MASESCHLVAHVLHAGLVYHHRASGTVMAAAAQVELRRVKAYVPVLNQSTRDSYTWRLK